jgi:hypothetical protein
VPAANASAAPPVTLGHGHTCAPTDESQLGLDRCRPLVAESWWGAGDDVLKGRSLGLWFCRAAAALTAECARPGVAPASRLPPTLQSCTSRWQASSAWAASCFPAGGGCWWQTPGGWPASPAAGMRGGAAQQFQAAELFADEAVASSARALPSDPSMAGCVVPGLADEWVQPQVADQVPRGWEATDLADGGHQREGGDRADAGQGEQPPHLRCAQHFGRQSGGPRRPARHPGSRSGAGSCRPWLAHRRAAPELSGWPATLARGCRTGRVLVGGRPGCGSALSGPGSSPWCGGAPAGCGGRPADAGLVCSRCPSTPRAGTQPLTAAPALGRRPCRSFCGPG